MIDEIKEILTRIRPDVDFDNQKQLITSEILDSFDIISILVELSERFMIDIDPYDVREEYFDSLDGIEKLVCTLKKEQRCD